MSHLCEKLWKYCVFNDHLKYKSTWTWISCLFAKTISMGQDHCPKCECQSTRSNSLRHHLTSGICSVDMESETLWDKKHSTMSKNLMQRFLEVINRKISWGYMTIKSMVSMIIVIQFLLMKMMKTNIILEKEQLWSLASCCCWSSQMPTRHFHWRCTTYSGEKSRNWHKEAEEDTFEIQSRGHKSLPMLPWRI